MTGFNWQREALLPALGALLEALWIWGLLTFGPALIDSIDAFAALPSRPVNLAWLWLLLGGPAVAGRWLDARYPGRATLHRWLLAATIALLWLAYVQSQVTAGTALPDWELLARSLWPWAFAGAEGSPWVIGLLVLLRAIWRAALEFNDDGSTGWFIAGLVAILAMTLLMAGSTPEPGLQAKVGVLLCTYFCVGLIWLALSHRLTLEERTFGQLRATFSPAFGGTLLMASLAMIFVAGLVAALQAFALQGILALGPVAHAAWPVLGEVVLAPARFVWFFVLVPLVGLLPPSWLRPSADQAAPDQGPPGRGGEPAMIDLPIFQLTIAWLVIVGAVVVVVAILLWREREHRQRGAMAWTRGGWQLWSVNDTVAGLRARLTGGPALVRQQPSDDADGHTIRRLYQALLRWCGEHGHARLDSATPLEFQQELGSALSDDLAARVTRAYVDVRYADHPDVPEVAGQLLADWKATVGGVSGD